MLLSRKLLFVLLFCMFNVNAFAFPTVNNASLNAQVINLEISFNATGAEHLTIDYFIILLAEDGRIYTLLDSGWSLVTDVNAVGGLLTTKAFTFNNIEAAISLPDQNILKGTVVFAIDFIPNGKMDFDLNNFYYGVKNF